MLRLLLVPSFVLAACAAVAGTLPPAPSGPPLLTVGGDIACTNDGDQAAFDLPGLESLGHDTIRTTTVWTEGEQEFEGVRLAAVLEAVCAEGGRVQAGALNDYRVRFPLDEMMLDGALIAYRRNGETMPLRDRGPLWIVFPWDDNAAYRTEEVYNRSVWQLERLDVID